MTRDFQVGSVKFDRLQRMAYIDGKVPGNATEPEEPNKSLIGKIIALSEEKI